MGLGWIISNENLRAHFPNEFSFINEESTDLLRKWAQDYQTKLSAGGP